MSKHNFRLTDKTLLARTHGPLFIFFFFGPLLPWADWTSSAGESTGSKMGNGIFGPGSGSDDEVGWVGVSVLYGWICRLPGTFFSFFCNFRGVNNFWNFTKTFAEKKVVPVYYIHRTPSSPPTMVDKNSQPRPPPPPLPLPPPIILLPKNRVEICLKTHTRYRKETHSQTSLRRPCSATPTPTLTSALSTPRRMIPLRRTLPRTPLRPPRPVPQRRLRPRQQCYGKIPLLLSRTCTRDPAGVA